MNTDPKAYNLNNRVLLKRSGDNHLTIIINRKSRIIMKDGERIVKQKDIKTTKVGGSTLSGPAVSFGYEKSSKRN